MTKDLSHLNIRYQRTGQKVEIRAVDIFQIENGKIGLARNITIRPLSSLAPTLPPGKWITDGLASSRHRDGARRCLSVRIEITMALPEQPQRRTRDARRARQTILDAAEAIFAEHGFNGARLDRVAKASGYDVSLLCQYFGDKVGLYSAVLGRAHEQTTSMQAQVLGRTLNDQTITADAQQFRGVLQSAVRTTFDYLLEHPRLLRILTWEMADGWRTYIRIASQFQPEEKLSQLDVVFKSAYRAGWLRSQLPAAIQLTLIFQLCQSYLAFLPFYEVIPGGERLSSAQELPAARQQLARFIVAGMMFDSPTPKRQDQTT
jgi:TetR/AcrR family transcriptional regulator